MIRLFIVTKCLIAPCGSLPASQKCCFSDTLLYSGMIFAYTFSILGKIGLISIRRTKLETEMTPSHEFYEQLKSGDRRLPYPGVLGVINPGVREVASSFPRM